MSKLIWVIVIIALVIVGFFIFSGDSDDSSEDIVESDLQEDVSEIDNAPDSEFNQLDSSNDVFDEIDSALEFA